MALVLYSREGCHLCDQMLEELDELLAGRATASIRDIDTDPALLAAHGARIPVLLLDDEELCFGRLSSAAVERLQQAFGLPARG